MSCKPDWINGAPWCPTHKVEFVNAEERKGLIVCPVGSEEDPERWPKPDAMEEWSEALKVFLHEINSQKQLGHLSESDQLQYQRGSSAICGFLGGLGYRLVSPR